MAAIAGHVAMHAVYETIPAVATGIVDKAIIGRAIAEIFTPFFII